MSSNEDVGEKREFKKRLHRPWKPDLLRDTLAKAASGSPASPVEDAVQAHAAPTYTSLTQQAYQTSQINPRQVNPAQSAYQQQSQQVAQPHAAHGYNQGQIEREINSPNIGHNTAAGYNAPIRRNEPITDNNQITDAENTTIDASVRYDYGVTGYAKSDFRASSFSAELPEISKFDEFRSATITAPNRQTGYTFDEFNSYLQTELDGRQQQKETLLKEMTVNSKNSAMSIGGFFQPNYVTTVEDSQSTKIDRLMSDLKLRETEISSLTNDLKMSQAMERAEQAELAKKMEEQAKVSAEKRMKQAIEQANSAAKQLQAAMEKVQQLERAHSEEERQKNIAIAQLTELSEQFKNSGLGLKAEQQARIAAEEKAQHALNQTVQTELSRQELEKSKHELESQIQGVLEELRKIETARKAEESARIEAEHKVQSLFQEKAKLEQTYKEEKTNLQRAFYEEKSKIDNVLQSTTKNNTDILGKITQLENMLQEAEVKTKRAEDDLNIVLDQKNKLQAIIDAEKNLRAIAERKAKEALAQAAQAEIARQAEERQRRLVDERAKRAVAHASKTVMHFLNAPVDDNLEKQLQEMRNGA